ncbi:MAG TPA: FGGY-family carbohydrate kinase [Geminicoccus sp.]|uniref:FGGY-family carbohydrate kinase n=1 Tax=Geminicoccus sp. TaxID=2024832 RepID=UPI002B7CD7EB|nr:FGGY-family carbohydrate kinase [Geminicoccus sp.]HWL71430.1 FGGY-family carbohydrate kinase [Geminicoccus sp.]
MNRLALGIDIGSSGVRASAVDRDGRLVAEAKAALPEPDRADGMIRTAAEDWWAAVETCLAGIPRERVAAVAVDGTSGTLLLCAADGTPLSLARRYDDAGSAAHAARIRELAPAESAAHGATSPAARLLDLQARHPDAAMALHQADWVVGRLTGRFGVSDDNNALKTGWDPVTRTWPDWLDGLGIARRLLPQVLEPGEVVGPALPELGFAKGAVVVAGTTDGCASFLATGADQPGDGVTALGTTLTLKLLSDRPVFDPAAGVYSHRLLGMWLAGGASNTGGAALLRFFTSEQMRAMEPGLNPDHPTGLDFWPLAGKGERFPIADPAMESRHEPRPAEDVRFFQALLEGVASVEHRAYRRLAELGAPKLRSVRTVGGGAANKAWTRIRQNLLGVPMLEPASEQASYGTALLARRAL